MCLLYTRAHPENGHEASSQFLFHLSAFMHSVTLGKSPSFSTFLCPLCVENRPSLRWLQESFYCVHAWSSAGT